MDEQSQDRFIENAPHALCRVDLHVQTAIRLLRIRCALALLTCAMVLPVLVTGCASSGPARPALSDDQATMRREALACLKSAITYRQNPAVRIQAIEAMQVAGVNEAVPWIRTALHDEHPAVRFAACVALGVMKDQGTREAMANLADDADPNVRLAASFAAHRLGNTRRSGLMPQLLLDSNDVTVRRNAALLLGLLQEPGVAPVLAKAMKDADLGVRHQALEALVRLGNREAGQELLFMTNAGVGSEEVFAVSALASAKNPIYYDTFAYKFAMASHLETKLAAAQGLGYLGSDRGIELALQSLSFERARPGDPNDSPEDQILRVRQLAAGALAAIGKHEALPALRHIMTDGSDPRMQVSAAEAILAILGPNRTGGLPFERQ